LFEYLEDMLGIMVMVSPKLSIFNWFEMTINYQIIYPKTYQYLSNDNKKKREKITKIMKYWKKNKSDIWYLIDTII
jgi:hypothetical protein